MLNCNPLFCLQVVGAGYIAVEMAQIFSGLGTDTTLAIRGQTVLRTFDPLISQAVTEEVERSGVRLERQVRASCCSLAGNE